MVFFYYQGIWQPYCKCSFFHKTKPLPADHETKMKHELDSANKKITGLKKHVQDLIADTPSHVQPMNYPLSVNEGHKKITQDYKGGGGYNKRRLQLTAMSSSWSNSFICVHIAMECTQVNILHPGCTPHISSLFITSFVS